MKTTKMSAILVLALGLMAWSAPIVHGAQYLKVNGQDVNSITLKMGQACFVEALSDDSTPYNAYVGFDNGLVLGVFMHLETVPLAGDLASVTVYNVPEFSGYFIVAAGSAPPPSAGIHFVFEYMTQHLGETDLKLYDSTFTSVIDSVHITVIPTSMGTAFTCQGRLMDDNSPADGLYDFRFKLYDNPDPVFAVQLEITIDINDFDVIDGQFAVELDFGSDVFGGDARWLETAVRPGDSNDPNAFVILSPRQELTPVPYALHAMHTRGIFVDDAGNVGIGTTNPSQKLDVDNGDIVVQGPDSFNSNGHQGSVYLGSVHHYVKGEYGFGVKIGTYAVGDALSIRELSGNVGIGTTTPSSKLDVNGDININSAYKIAGDTVLSTSGTRNIFVGVGAGYSNTEGSGNTFSGFGAGYSNTEGCCNTFSGFEAGYSNTTGYLNTFLGYEAGKFNTTGYANTFIGGDAGIHNTEGYDNTFLGDLAGFSNTKGYQNTFLGSGAGLENLTGSGNVFIGNMAGHNETGSDKLYIANGAADTNVLIYGEFDTGNVGIGTTNPKSKLSVGGDGFADTGVYGYSPAGHGIHGQSIQGAGVYGETAGLLYAAVQGETKEELNSGVVGKNMVTNTHGTLGGPDWGVKGFSAAGHGVKGYSIGGAGVYGETAGVSYAAVHGESTEELNAGVFGGNMVTNTRGSLGGPDWGVKGISMNDNGNGVEGYSTSGYGVYGSSIGYAGYFSGDVYVTGSLTKSSGSFKIDHPLDPENKYLSHSFVESPDMMNVYNGNAALDENGEACVQLPEYFEALNRDFRYQLTAIGAPAPNLYIAEKISDNHFKIAGGKPGMEVSWQVTGVRHDPYAVAHRVQVEEEKKDEERGYYLNPMAYGLPEEKGIESVRNPRVSETRQVAKGDVSYETD